MPQQQNRSLLTTVRFWVAAGLAANLAACGAPVSDLAKFNGQPVAEAPVLPAQEKALRFAGSSTVFPFSSTVAEQFGAATRFPTPNVESIGTGGGLAEFCKGVGPDTMSIANASRPIKKTEVANCLENGVTDILEMPIGFDGIVLANAVGAPDFNLTKSEIFLALAREVPDATGTLVTNPYKTWDQINPSLPDTDIRVLGPPPTSGTRDAFVEIAMDGGAHETVERLGLTSDAAKAVIAASKSMRGDGAWIDAGENDTSIIQTLIKNRQALGVLGFSFLEQNGDRVKAARVNGVDPSFDAIASGEYKVSRSMYLYIKLANVALVPGIPEFLAEFTKESTWGPEGYLADKGLIPLPAERRAEVRERTLALRPMDLSAFR
jgi:phosphate transport system substrate-binding protein